MEELQYDPMERTREENRRAAAARRAEAVVKAEAEIEPITDDAQEKEELPIEHSQPQKPRGLPII